MKIQQNQPQETQRTGSANQAQEPDPTQGSPKQSAFANILKKGKQGPAEEAAATFGEGGEGAGARTGWTGARPFAGPGKHSGPELGQGAEGGNAKTPGMPGSEKGMIIKDPQFGKAPELGPITPGGAEEAPLFKGHHKLAHGKEGKAGEAGKSFELGIRRSGEAVITHNVGAGGAPRQESRLSGMAGKAHEQEHEKVKAEHPLNLQASASSDAQPVRQLDHPAAQEVRGANTAAAVAQIHALAGEMVDKVQVSRGAAGDDRVDIQFNSKTLQGLQVSISQNDGKISVQFQTANEQVSQLLSQNVQALTQALANRGVDVADVRVAPPLASADSGRSSHGSDRDSGRGRGGSGGSGGGDGGHGQQQGGGR
jgi:hypothetical protein